MTEEAIYKPPVHALVVGDPGDGKSHFAATFQKPMLVCVFDGMGKDTPYLRRGKTTKHLIEGDYGINYREVKSVKTGETIIRLEYYNDPIPEIGKKGVYAYEKFLSRYAEVQAEIAEGMWATFVIDSLSMLQHCVIKLHEYKMNPTTKGGNQQDQRQHYREAASAVMELTCNRLAHMVCDVVCLTQYRRHEDKLRGTVHLLPDAPGQTPGRIPGQFSEVYRIYTEEDEDGTVGHYLQTVKSKDYIATTQISAPDGCVAHYKAIWANYQEQEWE